MLITLERNSGIPVFRQICEQIRFQVAAGILGPGSETPSTRELAAQLGINPMTVSKAYALLEQEGVLERRPGLSLVVRGRSERAEHGARLEELQRMLRPVALAAHQLGVPASEALELFRKALRAPGDQP